MPFLFKFFATKVFVDVSRPVIARNLFTIALVAIMPFAAIPLSKLYFNCSSPVVVGSVDPDFQSIFDQVFCPCGKIHL